MAYDILVLTDHRLHTTASPVYAFASALASDASVNSVDIASRGIEDNALFFDGMLEGVLSVIPAIPRLTFRRAKHLFETGFTESELADYDFVFLDLPHPFPQKLFHAIPEAIPEDHVINEPSGIIRTASHAFLREVAELCPPIQLIRKKTDLTEFLHSCPVAILRPLFGNDGQETFRITRSEVETALGKKLFHRPFFQQWSPPYLAMGYHDGVLDGIKRTLVVNGQVIGSLLYMLPEGAWDVLQAKRNTASHTLPDKEESRIAERLTPELARHGIVHYSFDSVRMIHHRRILTNLQINLPPEIRIIRDAQGKKILKPWIHQIIQHMDHVWFGDRMD